LLEKPTEKTYVGELVSVIKEIGKDLGFDAEVYWETSSGEPDILLKYNNRIVAVIEVKKPEISLSDPKANEQALRYAEWYRNKKGVKFYGLHNMKYIKFFKYVGEKKTLTDYIESGEGWVPVTDFPFPIIPDAQSIAEYKRISTDQQAKDNLRDFLRRFKDTLEGKMLDLSRYVIMRLRELIENGSSSGVAQLYDKYRRDNNIHSLVESWLEERGLERPKNDNELREYLNLMLKEQIYTFTIKLLFYLVLQSLDSEMAKRLKEGITSLKNPKDEEYFKRVAGELFKYAMDRTGDFEEVFGSNTVDRLPFMPASLQNIEEIVEYLDQIRWSEVGMDVIGRVFENLIHEERRHLLGQHYTDTRIVDLILMGVFRGMKKPEKLIDPACGSGTFLVRAINYWKMNFPQDNFYELIEGCDIDKLASMLSKINIYIQALEIVKKGYRYTPRIHREDFFKLKLSPDYVYVVANPPYTRQEQMVMAYYNKEYKKTLEDSVSDIEDWDKRASIYAYFLVRGGKILREGGKLGFIVENSWLNAEYGGPLKRWLFNNFNVNYIIESIIERWFEDAKVMTNIIIAEKRPSSQDHVTKFIYLKKSLRDLIDGPPPARDYVASQRYYEGIERIFLEADSCVPSADYIIYETDGMRVVACKKKLIDIIESKLGRLNIVKGPKQYLDLIFRFLEGKEDRLVLLKEIVNIQRGLTTNANEIFYLPSKYWRFHSETSDRLFLVSRGLKRKMGISKRYLRRLIRLDHLEDSTYLVKNLPSRGKEDYVFWVQDIREVDDQETREYIKWATNHIREEYRMSGGKKYPTIYKKLNEPEWLRLPSRSGGVLLFRSAVHRNYSIWFNAIPNAQIDKRLYIGYLADKYRDKILPEALFASANSIFTYIGMELMGRTNLGEGALDITTVDYEVIPIINPLELQIYLENRNLLDEFIRKVRDFLSTKPQNIEKEAARADRLEIERYILGYLGLKEDEIKSMYKELLALTDLRTQKAAIFLQ
jgi:type I restriction-modification system DNA methylase subunit